MCCFVCFVVKIKLCAENVISLCLFVYELINENFENCTKMYTRSMVNGIDCCNNQTSSLCLQQLWFVEWD